MSQSDWQKMSMKRILEVKQRIQTIVFYEELQEDDNGGDVAVQKEAIVDSYDRPMQSQYT